MILVSHDISEIMKVSDKVFKLEDGKISKTGSASEVFLEKQISGKFQFQGEIIKIEHQDFLSILHVLIGNNIVKVVADEAEESFEIGDNVLIASKAFNPIVTKI
jgi:molybdate transport system ATP-binding protein